MISLDDAVKIGLILGRHYADCADPEHHDSMRSIAEDLEKALDINEGRLVQFVENAAYRDRHAHWRTP